MHRTVCDPNSIKYALPLTVRVELRLQLRSLVPKDNEFIRDKLCHAIQFAPDSRKSPAVFAHSVTTSGKLRHFLQGQGQTVVRLRMQNQLGAKE